MNSLYEHNYLEFNFRNSSSVYSTYFEEDSSAGLQVETIPRRQVPYCDFYNNYLPTFVEVTELIDLSDSLIEDPLEKYRQIARKLDYSEIGKEEELLKEEIKVYFDQLNYRKRATSLFIDGEETNI